MPADIHDPAVLRAVQSARQDVLDKPNSAVAWGVLGMTLEAHLYEAEADRCFAQAARLDPADGRWPYFRGLYALKYDPDNALPFLRQAAACRSLPENQSAMRLRLAEALLERRELDEAEELFRQEERRAPANPRAAFGLGMIALARGDERGAEKYLTIARNSPTARARRQRSWRRSPRDAATTRSQTPWSKTPLLSPATRQAWPDPLVAQIIRLRVGPDSRAEELAQQVAELERQGRYREAAALYQRQIDEKPTVAAYLGAGFDMARQGDYDRALPLLHEAVRLDPDSFQAHYTLALVQFTRAEKQWQRSPGSPEAKKWLGDTIEQAQVAAKLKPDHARNYLHWGLALKYLGKPNEAIAPLRKGVACQPADIDLQLALGEVLHETGHDQEAQTYLENAWQLDPKDPRVIQAFEQLRKKKN